MFDFSVILYQLHVIMNWRLSVIMFIKLELVREALGLACYPGQNKINHVKSTGYPFRLLQVSHITK